MKEHIDMPRKISAELAGSKDAGLSLSFHVEIQAFRLLLIKS
jgi:hypothetical protein